jgi:hypothetical protein
MKGRTNVWDSSAGETLRADEMSSSVEIAAKQLEAVINQVETVC